MSRVGPAVTVLNDGRVMISGGRRPGLIDAEGALTSIEIYDPETEVFTEVAQLKVARFNHTATVLSDGTVLIVGGCQSGESSCWGEGFEMSYVYLTELIE